MADKFFTLLEDVGKDLVKGISKVVPYVTEAGTVATSLDPALGPILTLTLGVLAQASQVASNVANLPEGNTLSQTNNVVSILGPTLAQAFAAAGKPNDAATISKYVAAVENLLSNIPATKV
jgi:hypothetical protein